MTRTDPAPTAPGPEMDSADADAPRRARAHLRRWLLLLGALSLAPVGCKDHFTTCVSDAGAPSDAKTGADAASGSNGGGGGKGQAGNGGAAGAGTAGGGGGGGAAGAAPGGGGGAAGGAAGSAGASGAGGGDGP